jgi:hypothetical protein
MFERCVLAVRAEIPSTALISLFDAAPPPTE